jgi:hypothetical protein
MTKFIIDSERTLAGYRFRRSDGLQFFMIMNDDGSASLYAGRDIVGFDVNVSDKLAAARAHILAYQNKPTDG